MYQDLCGTGALYHVEDVHHGPSGIHEQTAALICGNPTFMSKYVTLKKKEKRFTQKEMCLSFLSDFPAQTNAIQRIHRPAHLLVHLTCTL